ncbi:MAG: hypothetical protein LKE30_05835 [Bacteroidales bacterium]|jgi:hypothetical protein|nr:hypothetical protein [Bacteroidales bacterium]
MKKTIVLLSILLLGIMFFLSCSDDNDKDTKIDSSSYNLYSKIGNDYWNENTNNLGTFYVKIPSLDNQSWFDIVISSDNINDSSTSLIHNYAYIHIDNSIITKSFSFSDSIIYPADKFSIQYYKNKSVCLPVSFDLYMKSISGNIVITKNDGVLMSGYFKGELKNQQNSNDIRQSEIRFKDVPISVAKK